VRTSGAPRVALARRRRGQVATTTSAPRSRQGVGARVVVTDNEVRMVARRPPPPARQRRTALTCRRLRVNQETCEMRVGGLSRKSLPRWNNSVSTNSTCDQVPCSGCHAEFRHLGVGGIGNNCRDACRRRIFAIRMESQLDARRCRHHSAPSGVMDGRPTVAGAETTHRLGVRTEFSRPWST